MNRHCIQRCSAASPSRLVILLLIVVQVAAMVALVESSQVEQGLLNRLVNGPRPNNRQLRPVKSHTQPVRVAIRVSIIDVIGLDENLGHVTVKLWLSLRWTDEYLSWNPAQYDGIQRMNLATGPDSRIWTPDIVMFSALNAETPPALNADAVVSSDGTVTWVRPVIYTVATTQEFRTNSWSTGFRFGSWSYDASRLDLQPDVGLDSASSGNVVPGATGPETTPSIRMEIGNFVQTGHWSILEARGRHESSVYPCCPDEPYSSIAFSLKLRKKAVNSLMGRRGL